MDNVTLTEYELVKLIGDIERAHLEKMREATRPYEIELEKLRTRNNYIGPLAESKPFMGTFFHRMFGFDV